MNAKISPIFLTYYSLSSLSFKDMHKPPALNHLMTKEIEEFQEHKLNLEHPCNNQAVKCLIKLVSEASAAVAGLKNRDGFIRQKIRLRKTFNIKNSLVPEKLGKLII